MMLLPCCISKLNEFDLHDVRYLEWYEDNHRTELYIYIYIYIYIEGFIPGITRLSGRLRHILKVYFQVLHPEALPSDNYYKKGKVVPQPINIPRI